MPVPFDHPEIGRMVDVKVRPAAVGGRLQLNMQAEGSSLALHLLDGNRPDRVRRPLRPDEPIAAHDARFPFEVLARDHLAPFVQIDDFDVVKIDDSSARAEPEMHRAGRGAFPRDELELHRPDARPDDERCRTGDAEEHPRSHGPAVHQEPRCARRGVHPDGQRACPLGGRPERARGPQQDDGAGDLDSSRAGRVHSSDSLIRLAGCFLLV
jgi:hypothetical protein